MHINGSHSILMLLRPITCDLSEIIIALVPEKVSRIARWKDHIEQGWLFDCLEELDRPMDIESSVNLHLVVLESPDI